MSEIKPAATAPQRLRSFATRLGGKIKGAAASAYRPPSIRGRLLIWQAVILSAVVAGFGTTLYWQARSASMDQVDADLLGVAQVLAAQLQQPESKGDLAIPDTYRHRLGMASRDAPYFVIWNATGKTLASSEHAPADLHPEAKPPATKGPRPFQGRNRGISREVIVAGPDNSQILVGRPLHREENYLRRMFGTVLGVGCGVLLLGLAGAWLLARAIVAPLERMTDTAERISAANLSERIDVSHPRSEPGRLAVVLNQMFDRLQGAFERQARFTADASHELRTPVSVVMSQAELALARERSPADYQEALAACLRASKRMKTLIDGLLTLARADAGQLETRREPIDLRQIVENSLSLIRPLAEQRQIELSRELQSVEIRGDAERLSQVLANLLGNAIAYNHDGGQVRVTLSQQPGHALLTVSDTGLGMEAGDLPRIFERFYRVDPSRSGNRGGSGLGLAICQEIVRSHGGTIEATSSVGEGTIFTVTFPNGNAS